MRPYLLPVLLLIILTNQGVFSQNRMVSIEAESGTIGSDYEINNQNNITYVSIKTNGAVQNPESEARTISYNINFPDSGTYLLFAKIRVGAGGANDDSFFYGNGFGSKTITNDDDWITVNQLNSAGYTLPNDFIIGDGTAANNIWKWVNISAFSLAELKMTLRVDKTTLEKVFQIGAREDGLEFDKIVFAPSGFYYTVQNLENREQGVTVMPEDLTDKPLAYGLSKFVGCCYASHSKTNFEKYWNQLVPENAGKWGSAEPSRDVMSWGSLDEAYNFAQKNGFPYRHHVLVWGNQQPSWIENLSTADQLEEIEEWFSAVANRYPKIEFLEVVNEALHDPPNQPGNGGGNYINALGGKGTSGYDWIITAFRLARKHFPETTKLMINEYGLTDNANNVREYKKIIELLKKEDLIDAVGIQGHAFNTTVSASTIKSNLDLLAQVNLPIYITELDIDGSSDAIQLSSYKKIIPVFWEHPAVKGITLWGFRSGMWRTDQKAYLLNADGSERPAMTWFREYLRSFVSVDEMLLNTTYTLYPNPVNARKLTITGTENISMIRFYTTSGKLLRTLASDAQQSITLDIDFLPGIYIVQLVSKEQIISRKIVVK